MMTIEESKIEKFPFKEGDRVKVNWKSSEKIQFGSISKIYTSQQWGCTVVHAVMILFDGDKKPCSVSTAIIEKIKKNQTPAQLQLSF